MVSLLKMRAEMHNLFQKSFRSLKENFVSKNSRKLFLLWNVNHFKHNFVRNIASQSLKSDDILVYECNNSKFFKKLKIISTAQYIVWTLWGISSYDNARRSYLRVQQSDGKETAESARKMKLVMNLMIISCLIGTAVFILVWLFILRSVKCIKVNKPNRKIIFETYSPFLKGKEFYVPLQNVSGVKSRIRSKTYVPLKIKNKLFYYLVDLNGNLKDEVIFDTVVSLKRDLS